jgi:hypothetical protein
MRDRVRVLHVDDDPDFADLSGTCPAASTSRTTAPASPQRTARKSSSGGTRPPRTASDASVDEPGEATVDDASEASVDTPE